MKFFFKDFFSEILIWKNGRENKFDDNNKKYGAGPEEGLLEKRFWKRLDSRVYSDSVGVKQGKNLVRNVMSSLVTAIMATPFVRETPSTPTGRAITTGMKSADWNFLRLSDLMI